MEKFPSTQTTLMESKRLIEIGMPSFTADYVTSLYGGSTFYVDNDSQLKTRCIDSGNYYPCWSFGRLLQIVNYLCGSNAFWESVVDGNNILHTILHEIHDMHMKGQINFSKLEE